MSERQRFLFLPCQFSSPEPSPLFGHMASYQLRHYLNGCDDIAAAYDLQVMPWRVPVPCHESFVDEWCHLEILENVRQRRPRVVAFSLYVWSIGPCRDLARFLKRAHPDILIIAGGPEVADRERFVQEYDAFDVVVEGPGELPASRLLRRLAAGDTNLDGISNLSFRRPDGSFAHNPGEVETQPDVRNSSFYLQHAPLIQGDVNLLLTGGCPYRCTFCLWSVSPTEPKSKDEMLATVEAIVTAGRVGRLIVFDFDLVALYRESPGMLARIGSLLRQNGNPEVSFFTSPGTLADPTILRLAADVRLTQVLVGVQSMNPDVLRAAGRGWSVKHLPGLADVPDAAKRLARIELMLPLPGETPQSYYDGLERLISLGYHRFHIFPMMVLRGTAMRRHAQELGLRYFSEPPYLCCETPTFPAQDWYDACAVSRVLNDISEEMVSSPDSAERAQAIFQSRRGLIPEILQQVRDGTPVATIRRELFRSVGIPVASGADGEDPAHPATTGQPLPRVPSIAARVEFPAEGVLRGVVERHGLCWVETRTNGDGLEIHATEGGHPLVLMLFPKARPDSFFRAGERMKVAYSGPLHDTAVLDEVLALADSVGPAIDERA